MNFQFLPPTQSVWRVGSIPHPSFISLEIRWEIITENELVIQYIGYSHQLKGRCRIHVYTYPLNELKWTHTGSFSEWQGSHAAWATVFVLCLKKLSLIAASQQQWASTIYDVYTRTYTRRYTVLLFFSLFWGWGGGGWYASGVGRPLRA